MHATRAKQRCAFGNGQIVGISGVSGLLVHVFCFWQATVCASLLVHRDGRKMIEALYYLFAVGFRTSRTFELVSQLFDAHTVCVHYGGRNANQCSLPKLHIIA